MKQGWEIKKLGEVCSITMGQSPSSDTYNDIEGLPFFQGNADFGKIHPSVRVFCNAPIRIADVNDILISVRAPIGAINIADCTCCIGRGLASIRNNAEVANEYIYHALIANKEKLIEQGTGSTFKSIGKEALKELSIPVPPIEVQERIVEELDCLSGVIEKKREQLKELDALAESIFYTMFGDPITNEKGWEVKKLGEVCTINPPKKEVVTRFESGDEISFLPMEDLAIKACYIQSKQTRLYGEVQSSYTYFANGDVLLAKVSPCFENGKIGIANGLVNGVGFGSSEYIVFRLGMSILKEYLYHYLQDATFVEEATKNLTGTSGLRRVPKSFIETRNICIPPLALQQEFADKIEAIEKQKELIKQSITETEELFNSRMDYYFN